MTDQMPQWERRVRTPALLSFSLLGPPAVWARDAERVALLSTSSGRVEVHVADLTDGTMHQVTDRPDGTTGLCLSPDGATAFWFDDERGSELGRWVRHPLDGRDPDTVLPALSPGYGFGHIVPLADGTVVVGRVTDTGFELGVETADGTSDVPYRIDQPAGLADITSDGRFALLQVADGSDWLHPGSCVVDLSDGTVVARRARRGRLHDPVGFRPDSTTQVLVRVEPQDRSAIALWDITTDAVTVLPVEADGDLDARWFPDGRSLAVVELRDARHVVHHFDLETNALTTLADDLGVVHAFAARADGSVHVLTSRSDRPVTIQRLTAAGAMPVVDLHADPPPSVRAQDVWADGPEGAVHALLSVPGQREAPHPTLFVVHGGPTGQDLDAWNDMGSAYLDAGYAVVRVNYRGSTGYGARWRNALHRRLGFIELEDVAAVRQSLETAGLVDPDRVSIVGGSWGGYLTLMALGTEPGRWRSGVALVPLADWATSVEDEAPFMLEYDEALFGGSIDELPEQYRLSSPLTYVDEVVAPVFITAGEQDPRCPVRQVDVYVAALRARGHDVHYDRLEVGHAMPDLDMKVAEMRGFLEFLQRTNPA